MSCIRKRNNSQSSVPQKHLSGLTERESVSTESPIKIAGSSFQKFELSAFGVLGGMGFLDNFIFKAKPPNHELRQ